MSEPLRILVVEDNAINRRLASDILRLRGHVVTEAADADEAMARAGESRPDVVLMDIHIPGGGGEAVLRKMRRDERLARVPVIAVTALAMAGDRERLLAAGFDGYVSKPIDTSTFAQTVESYAVRTGKKD